MIWDPASTRTISVSSQQQKTNFNIFEGLTCHGAPSVVINGGCVSVDEDGASINHTSGYNVFRCFFITFSLNIDGLHTFHTYSLVNSTSGELMFFYFSAACDTGRWSFYPRCLW